MEPLHVAHLIFVAMWGGVVAAEVVIELTLREGEAARIGAEAHYWIDLFVEGPLLVAILGTGGVLLWRAWPPTALHVVKVACALVAIGVNGWCVAMVVARRRLAHAPEAVAHYRRRVLLAGAGAPFAFVAVYIGLAFF